MKAQVHISKTRLAQLIPGAIVIVGLAVLAVAFIAEHAFGIEPCILCLYQRAAYGVSAIFGMIALVPSVLSQTRTRLIASCGVVFLGGAGIALHQVGLQQHWWSGFSACGGGLPAEMSLSELKARLTTPQAARCDEVGWSLFGLSIAAYNVGLFLFLAIVSLMGAHKLGLAAGHGFAQRPEGAPQWQRRSGPVASSVGEREIGRPIGRGGKAGWSPSVKSILPRGIMPPIWRRASRRESDEVVSSPYREPRQHGPAGDW